METKLKPCRTEYWLLPQTIQESINLHQHPFLTAYKAKIEAIQFAYSKPINDRQQAFLAKDEALIAETESFINFLGEKIDFLLREHKTLNEMLAVAMEENRTLQSENINLLVEISRIQQSYKSF